MLIFISPAKFCDFSYWIMLEMHLLNSMLNFLNKFKTLTFHYEFNLSFCICSSIYSIREPYSFFLLGWISSKKLNIDWSSQKILLVHLMFWKFHIDIKSIQSIAVFVRIVTVSHSLAINGQWTIVVELEKKRIRDHWISL